MEQTVHARICVLVALCCGAACPDSHPSASVETLHLSGLGSSLWPCSSERAKGPEYKQALANVTLSACLQRLVGERATHVSKPSCRHRGQALPLNLFGRHTCYQALQECRRLRALEDYRLAQVLGKVGICASTQVGRCV
jgi:hypothetical protein